MQGTIKDVRGIQPPAISAKWPPQHGRLLPTISASLPILAIFLGLIPILSEIRRVGQPLYNIMLLL